MSDLVKSPYWTWKSNIKYWFWRMPLNVLKTIPAILKGEPRINDMTWRNYVGLAMAMADAQTGRMWEKKKS